MMTIAQLDAENTSLTNQLADARLKIEALQADNARLMASAGNVAAAVARASEPLIKEANEAKAAVNELRKQNADLTERLQFAESDMETKAARKALEITAGQGIPPVCITTSGYPAIESRDDSVSLRDQYLAISDPAQRAAFWEKHGNNILK